MRNRNIIKSIFLIVALLLCGCSSKANNNVNQNQFFKIHANAPSLPFPSAVRSCIGNIPCTRPCRIERNAEITAPQRRSAFSAARSPLRQCCQSHQPFFLPAVPVPPLPTAGCLSLLSPSSFSFP